MYFYKVVDFNGEWMWIRRTDDVYLVDPHYLSLFLDLITTLGWNVVLEPVDFPKASCE